MKTICCILAVSCLYLNGLAQPIPTLNTGINIGETMPDIMLSNIKNNSFTTTPFSALQKQLTIVDFWASWCGACVGSFSKMHALQKKYTGQLQLLMVNSSPGDDAKKLAGFFKQRKTKTGKNFTLTHLVEDSVFSSLFPHKVIPHYVWIDKNRKVLAITEGDDVNEANIEAVLNGEIPGFKFKNDALLFDDEKDQLIEDDMSANDEMIYRSMIMAEKKGAGSKIFYEPAGSGKIKLLRVLNYSLLNLYQMSNQEVFKYGMSRLVIDTSISALFNKRKDGSLGNKYSYELQTKPISRKEALQWMNADLVRHFNVTAIAEERLTVCYVISAGKDIAKIHTQNGVASTQLDKENIRNYILNGKPEELRGILEMILQKPVINETGLTKNIDIEFPEGFLHFNPQKMQSFLEHYGIILQLKERLMLVPRLKSNPDQLQLSN